MKLSISARFLEFIYCILDFLDEAKSLRAELEVLASSRESKVEGLL